jgi:hypothetical protein
MRTPILVFDDSELPATQLERRVTRESQLEIDSYYVSILTAMAQETWSTLERVGEVSWPLRVCLSPTYPRLLAHDTFSYKNE